MKLKLCTFCAQPIAENSRYCLEPKCSESQARIVTSELDSHGIPRIRKGWCSQPEEKRLRKQTLIRMLPGTKGRIHAAAAAEGISAADLVERWALSLPVD